MQTLVAVVDLLVVVLVLVEEFRVHIMVVEHSPTPLAQKVAMDLIIWVILINLLIN